MSDAPAGVRGIVVGHGNLAAGLVDAVRQIIGEQGDALVSVSNSGRSPESVLEELRAHAERGPAIIFTDLPSGSCAFAARRLGLESGTVPVVCGVNLPLLLDFATHRELPLADLLPRIMERGRTSIVGTPPRNPESHGDRAVSGG